MANNIVSRWLHDVPKQDALDATNYEKAARIRDYAAKLDRLVEAAEAVNKQRSARSHSLDCRCHWCVASDELAAALAAIKLPEEANGGE